MSVQRLLGSLWKGQGTEAFDYLDKLADKLVDCCKTEVWAREMKQKLRSSTEAIP